MTLDTAVKPIYNVIDDDDDASDIDVQWNIYVILLLRRHKLLTIKSMKYDPKKECHLIRVHILDDVLRKEVTQAPQIIRDIRDREAAGFETEIKRLKNGIDFAKECAGLKCLIQPMIRFLCTVGAAGNTLTRK